MKVVYLFNFFEIRLPGPDAEQVFQSAGTGVVGMLASVSQGAGASVPTGTACAVIFMYGTSRSRSCLRQHLDTLAPGLGRIEQPGLEQPKLE